MATRSPRFGSTLRVRRVNPEQAHLRAHLGAGVQSSVRYQAEGVQIDSAVV